METLHFECDCRDCRARLSDLLRRELEDTARLTGCSITGLCRCIANDPSLHHDLKVAGRILTARTLQRYLDATRDFLLDCALAEDAQEGALPRVPASPKGED